MYRKGTEWSFFEVCQMVRYSVMAAAIALATPGCGAPLKSGPEPLDLPYKPMAGGPENPVQNNKPIDERFRTLDEYLAFLRRGGAIDKPWYREVRPGVYELVTSYRPVGGAETPRYFTREELAKKFGFEE
jgi:hypothetical protein